MNCKYLFVLCLFGSLSGKITAQKIVEKNNRLHASISGRIRELKAGDSVKITIWKYGIKVPEMKTSICIVSQNGSFPIVDFPLSTPAYITVYVPGLDSLYLENYLAEPGDRILVSHTGSFTFSGKGDAKYKFRYASDSLGFSLSRQSHIPPPGSNGYYDYLDSCLHKRLALLEKYRPFMTSLAYGLLKADLLSLDGIAKIKTAGLSIGNLYSSSMVKGLDLYKDRFQFLERDSNIFNGNVIKYAVYFPEFFFRKTIIDSFLISKKNWDLLTMYHMVRSRFYGFARERLLTSLITRYRNDSDNVSSCIRDALSIIKTPEFRNILTDLFQSGEKGVQAYPFSLPDSSGKNIRLADFKGKAILLDLWFTGCGACKIIAPKLAEIKKYFTGKAINFVSISIDKDKQDWIHSLQKGLYTSPGIINLYTAGIGEDHPLIQHYKISGYPTLILIDKNGLVYSTRVPDPKKENGSKELINMIEEALAK